MSRRPAACAAVLLLLASRPVRADDVAAARAHFRAGSAAYARGAWAEALGEFEAAAQLRRHPSITFNLGRCHDRLGHLAQALSAYRAYLDEVPRAPDAGTVRRWVTRLERAQAARGLQGLELASEPSGAAALLDGEAAGTTPLVRDVPVGTHRLRLEAPGYVPREEALSLVPGPPLVLRWELETVSPERPSRPPALPVTSAPEVPAREDLTRAPVAAVRETSATEVRAGRSGKVWTWVALGASAAAVAGAVAFGLAARSDSNTLRDGAQRTGAQNQSLRSSAESKAAASTGLWIGAGAAAATGIGLFFVEGGF